MNMVWHDVFDSMDITGKSDAELCAIGLASWANCMAGSKPPKSFGEMMVKISAKLGIIGSPDGFMEASKRFTA